MSSRSLAGILFLFAALLLPWMFRDWLPGYADPVPPEFSEPVTVPALEGARAKRPFLEIEAPASHSGGSVSRERNLPSGRADSFSTSAKAFLNKATRSRGIPQSTRSTDAMDRHELRLQNEMIRLGMQLGDPVFCRVFKEENELELWLLREGRTEFSLFRVYRILEWSGKTGPKTKEGDHQAPEGFYYVNPGKLIPQSKYHMGFDLGYPNEFDRLHGRTGSNVLVHGKTVSHSSYAMGDDSIEEIFTIVAAAMERGQPYFRVHCFPFRMEDKVMDEKLIGRENVEEFWANLKEGYDFFEIMRRPPNVTISSHGRYYFSHQ